MPHDYFDGPVAASYDEREQEMFAPGVLGPAVDRLAALAGDGAALELGIGTGRIALPLRERGVHVAGVDLSEAMVERLRAKPGGAEVPVTIGDFSSVRVEGPFTLVYLVFNTIDNLTTQDAQVACFENAARHLAPGGRFVIEVGVPELQGLARGQRFVPFAVTADHVGVDEYDVVTQGLVSHHFYRRPDGSYERSSAPFRYVWPAELDLMARLAGLTLEDRWSDWNGRPFTADSTSHVSVWRVTHQS
ncbi:MAG TPA: class I SAM-dependent methyltransferase [Mycobacteriales bacterium]|nr:class I SAM-dependent methyltransferase [Mycobacteriales bacterium]